MGDGLAGRNLKPARLPQSWRELTRRKGLRVVTIATDACKSRLLLLCTCYGPMHHACSRTDLCLQLELASPDAQPSAQHHKQLRNSTPSLNKGLH